MRIEHTIRNCVWGYRENSLDMVVVPEPGAIIVKATNEGRSIVSVIFRITANNQLVASIYHGHESTPSHTVILIDDIDAKKGA